MAHKPTLTIDVHHADRTRRARVTIPADMTAGQLVKVCRKRWSLPFSVDFQVANSRNGMMLLAQDTLQASNVQNGDTLVLQPFAVHG